MVKWVYRGVDRLGSVLLPPRCLLCHGPGAAPGRDLCTDCEADLPWLVAACPRCGLPPPPPGAGGDGCARCRDRAQPHRSCHAPFAYGFPLTELIPSLKYQGALSCARVLGILLAESVARTRLFADVAVVVPMPLHRSRVVERGFNQALELARFASAALGVPLDPLALQRTRATEPQVGLPRAERSRNVCGAFFAQASRVAQRNVVVLDDVVTTGATVAAAAQALLDAGAARVDAWCVARAMAG